MYKRRILNDHTTTCYMKPVPCPNGCEQEVISKKLNHHLAHECSQRTIACPYKTYGCNQPIKYRDMEEHNKENQIQHLQYQMAYVLAQNEQKTQQILQLQSRVTQMDAPDVILVDGWGEGDPQEAQINGIYKKQKLSTRLMDKWGEYKSINDEKEVENKNSIANRNDNEHIARPYYTKTEGDIECKLYFTPHTSEWVFECKEFKGCCQDNALYPTAIKNNKWKVFNRSMIVIDT
eukprot:369495_1